MSERDTREYAKPVERSIRSYLEFEVPLRALLEAFIPPELHGTAEQGYRWTVHSNGDESEHMVRFLRVKEEAWTYDAEGRQIAKPDDRADDMVMSRKEVREMLEQAKKASEGG